MLWIIYKKIVFDWFCFSKNYIIFFFCTNLKIIWNIFISSPRQCLTCLSGIFISNFCICYKFTWNVNIYRQQSSLKFYKHLIKKKRLNYRKCVNFIFKLTLRQKPHVYKINDETNLHYIYYWLHKIRLHNSKINSSYSSHTKKNTSLGFCFFSSLQSNIILVTRPANQSPLYVLHWNV